jgi:hypothetical protein
MVLDLDVDIFGSKLSVGRRYRSILEAPPNGRRNIMWHKVTLALPVVAALLASGPSGQAATLDPADAAAAEQAFTAALGCSRQAAVAVALKAVGGGRVIQVVYEGGDRPPHWSIDIVGSTKEHEVWVNVSCKVIKIITQPL